MADGKANRVKIGRRSRRVRQVAAWAGVCLAAYCVFFVFRAPRSGGLYIGNAFGTKTPDARTLDSLFLTEKQCRNAFPGLTQAIDDIVAEGPFTVQDRGDLGPLQGRIKDGKASSVRALAVWHVMLTRVALHPQYTEEARLV
jgi:hypothetical protein